MSKLKKMWRKKGKKLIFLLLVIGLVLPSIWPLFKNGFFPMHDYTHVARLVELDKAIKDGHFPARWAKDLGWGYGMPLFHFYAPLPYYLGEVFHLFGFSFLNSIKIVFGLTFFLAFGGMFLFAKKFWGKSGAFLAALAFVYSPYRAVDFYVRGALGELFAISLIPWVFWSITNLLEKSKKVKKDIAGLALCLSAFLLSHTVLDLVCLPLFILYALIYSLMVKLSFKKSLTLAGAFLLGLGLAGFFLLPAFFEKQFTGVEKLTTGFSYYGHHFLYFKQFISGTWGYGGSVDGPNDGMSFHLGKLHLLLALIAIILAAVSWLKRKKATKKELMSGLSLVLIAGLVFLSTYHAKAVWDSLPLLAYVQFPWRLNSMIIVWLAFLGGGGVFYLKKMLKNKTYLIFLWLAACLLIKINLNYFQPQRYIYANSLYFSDENLIKEQMSQVIPDYLPRWVTHQPAEIATSDFKVISGAPEIKVTTSKTQELVLTVNSASEFSLQLNRFYFPGWQIFINNQPVGFEYQNNNGIINLSLPAGSYDLKLIYTNTLVRAIANLVSGLSLLTVFILQ
jgi:hypothetical protein